MALENATAEAPETDAGTQNFAELIGDLIPEAPPSTTEATETVAEEPVVSADAASTEGQEAEPQPQPTVPEPKPPVELTYGGKKFTPEQIAKDVDLLKSVLTTAEQFPNLQRKYVETLEKMRQAEQAPPPPPAQPVQRATPEDIRHNVAPIVTAAVKDGYIEESFVEVFPNAAAQMAFYANRVDQGVQLVTNLLQRLGSIEHQSVSERVVGSLNSTLDEMAKSDEIFEPLATPEVRSSFIGYLRELNPMADQVTRDFLDRQYLAFHSKAIYEARRAEKAKAEAELKTKRGRATGAGQGARPGVPPAKETDPQALTMNELIGDLLPPARS